MFVSGNYGIYIRFPAQLPWGGCNGPGALSKLTRPGRTNLLVGTPKGPVAYMPTYIAANLQ